MSNLQILARRCPVMGKAIAIQSAKRGSGGLNCALGGTRSYGGKAKFHTSRVQRASVAPDVVRHDNECEQKRVLKHALDKLISN